MNPNQELGHLFELYHDILYKQCLHMVSYNHQYISLIDDCIQYAFLQALLKPRQFAQCKNPAGWLSVTARRHLISEIRKNSRRSKILAQWQDNTEEKASLQLETDIERWHNQQEASESVEQILKLLSSKEKEIFHGYFLQGFSIDEVAKNLKTSRSVVRGAIDRIRAKARNNRILSFFVVVFPWILQLMRDI